MDKNSREKTLFAEWAKSDGQDYFMLASDAESYFVKRENADYIREYGFETVPELRDELEKMWDGDNNMKAILTAVIAAAIKNRPREQEETGKAGQVQMASDKKEELPMYIYNF